MRTFEEILQIFEAKEIDKDWSFAGYKPSETGKWTHSYHRYPAKFIPQLVERLFDEYIHDGEAHINDPFCGSGTTIATAISRGFRASGTDINRMAYLITKAKSTPIEPDYLDRKIGQLLSTLDGLGNTQMTLFRKEIEPLIQERHIERIDYWFTEENKIELGRILRVIHEEDDEIVRNFFLVTFSHILKNCSIWLQGSTKPTRDFKKKPSEPHITLKRHLRKMQRGNAAFYSTVPSKLREDIDYYLDVIISDARSLPAPDGSVDLIVSSSPYVTSYEYADLHQLSTIWLDLADDLKEYRKKFIGTAYKEYEQKKPRSGLALDIADGMRGKSNKMAEEIEAFFIDMETKSRLKFQKADHSNGVLFKTYDRIAY